MARIRVALVVLVVGLAVGVGEASGWNSNYFKSPTGNIRCRYYPHSTPRVLVCITLNNGRIVGVTPSGRSYVTYTRSGYLFPVGPTLRYGDWWRWQGFRCDSRRSGMTCRSLRTGYGFFISRSSYRLF